MPIKAKDQILRDNLYNTFRGLDLTSSITAMEPNTVRQADNTDIIVSGSAQTRAGYENTLTNSIWLGRKIQNGLEYQVNSVTTQVLVAGCQSIAGSGELGEATTSVTSIRAGLDNQRPSLIQFGNLVFYFNGLDDFLYDGTTTRQIGITPPGSAPTDNGDFPGNLVIGATYAWAYTYYNSVTGAESSPSPLIDPFVVIGAGGGRQLNITPGDPTTADTIRVYRTTANGPILFLDGTTGIAAVTYDSTIADAGLGIEMELDNTRLATWGTVKYAVENGNRIFVTGFQNPLQNRVRFSKIGQEGPMPESYQAVAFVDCISNDGLGDTNIGLGTAFQSTMVLKEKSIGRLDPAGSYTSEIGVDNVIYQYNEIARNITGVSHWAITNVLNNMVWMGKDNIYMTDGTNVVPIGNRISNYIKTLNFASPERLSATNDVKNRKIMFTAMSTQATEPDIIIAGSYKDFPEFYWTLYVQGPNVMTHPGISAGCFFPVTQPDNSQDIYFGNTSFNGKLYHLGIGNNDDGFPIYWKLVDYPTDYDLEEETKLFMKDILFMQGNGSNYGVTVSSIYDLSDFEEEQLQVSVFNNGAVWDESLWDVATWQSAGPLRGEHSSHRKATFKQLAFQTIGYEDQDPSGSLQDQPVTVFGWTKAARPEWFK